MRFWRLTGLGASCFRVGCDFSNLKGDGYLKRFFVVYRWRVQIVGTPAPRNHDSYVAPSVVNDVVLVGTSGSRGESIEPVGPGLLTPLNKRTGKVLRQIKLDAVFKRGIAAVQDYVMFGTGYGGIHTPEPGSFNVWKSRRKLVVRRLWRRARWRSFKMRP